MLLPAPRSLASSSRCRSHKSDDTFTKYNMQYTVEPSLYNEYGTYSYKRMRGQLLWAFVQHSGR